MRFIHTADWHLGRLFHGRHLTEDQAYVLEQVVEVAKDFKAEAVVVSGDIYDRPVPPADAVALLDDVLSRLVLGLRIPVLVIAGNHDSPNRLEFGSRVLWGQGLHLFGSPAAHTAPVTLPDAAGPVRFYALPFAEPAVVREKLGCDEVADHQGAMERLVGGLRQIHPAGVRSVIVAHAFVTGAASSESERPLSVGGADRVSADVFAGFDYVALGHLHRPQGVGEDRLSYSGSLLKYSFSEWKDSKGITMVEMDPAGTCRVERIPLRPLREVRRIQGLLDDILKGPAPGENPEDYLLVELLDTRALLDAMGRLREVYPNVLHLERPCLTVDGSRVEPTDHRKLNDAALFASFYAQVTTRELAPEQAEAYEAIVEKLRREEREAGSV